jgi:hypothetical protein
MGAERVLTEKMRECSLDWTIQTAYCKVFTVKRIGDKSGLCPLFLVWSMLHDWGSMYG